MRRLLVRVFSAGLRSLIYPWAKAGPLRTQEQVDRDTPVSRTPIVAPRSLARKRALSRERRVRGPQKAAGPSNSTRQRMRFEDLVKMQRPRMYGTTASGETNRRVSQQSPSHQTVMMARHFTAEHCADTPIPALGLDASTLVVPFKCSLLDASGTSSSPSSTASSSDTSLCNGSLCLLRRRWIWLGGKMPWAPPRQPKQGEGSRPVDA
jgi:hypothetical protein